MNLFYSLFIRFFFLLFFLLLFSSGAAAGQEVGQPGTVSIAQRFEQVNRLYIQGEYQRAIDGYLSIVEDNGMSASLLYNLGNSYAAAGQPGWAVLNYERALRLAPGSGDIEANLEQVRKDAGLYLDDEPFYLQFTGLLAADQWLLLAGAAFVLLSLTLLLSILRPQGGKTKTGAMAWVRGISFSCLILILIALPLSIFSYQGQDDGVVIGEDVRLLLSPFAEAASTGSIKAGRLVRPGSEHGDFVLITDETGHSGWLARESFQRIMIRKANR